MEEASDAGAYIALALAGLWAARGPSRRRVPGSQKGRRVQQRADQERERKRGTPSFRAGSATLEGGGGRHKIIQKKLRRTRRDHSTQPTAPHRLANALPTMIRVARLRGLTSYADGLTLQRLLLSRLRASGGQFQQPDTLLLLEHEPVFTLGRIQASAANVLASEAEIAAAGASVVQSDRGGNVTFHGPGQLVAYPILDLRRHRQDLRWYVSQLEEAMIGACAKFGIAAHAGGDGQTGVWVKGEQASRGASSGETVGEGGEESGGDERKIGAIGVRVNRWYASHGIALNADVDLKYFDMIVPCGLSATPNVTSLTREAGRRIGVDELAPLFTDAFSEALGVEVEEGDVDGLVREMRAAKAMEALRTQR